MQIACSSGRNWACEHVETSLGSCYEEQRDGRGAAEGGSCLLALAWHSHKSCTQKSFNPCLGAGLDACHGAEIAHPRPPPQPRT